MVQEGKRSLRSWRGRLEKVAALFFEATLPIVAALAAALVYASLAADFNSRQQRLLLYTNLVLWIYGFSRRALGAYREGQLGRYVAKHRFGGTVALLCPFYLLILSLVQCLALLVPGTFIHWLQICLNLGFLLGLLILCDLFSSAFYQLLVFLSRHLRVPPPLLIVISFALVIGIGTLFLMSPKATHRGNPISFLDALFTATSATCVTGLAVRDTGAELTQFGHVVILALFQIGGLGLMTFASFFSLFLGQGLGIKEGLVLRDALNLKSLSKARPLVFFILKATLIIELLGAVLIYFSLSPYWKPELGFLERLWISLFHSVSAFCNAGFSTFPEGLIQQGASLESFNTSWTVLSAFSFLIIFGGLGFMVMLGFVEGYSLSKRGLLARLRSALRSLRIRMIYLLPRALRRFVYSAYSGANPRVYDKTLTPRPRASVHSSIVLWSTFMLCSIGFVGIYLFEYNGPLFANQSTKERIATAAFQSVTSRTAGFNSVPYGPGASFPCHLSLDKDEQSILVGAKRPGDSIVCPKCRETRILQSSEFYPGLSTSSLFLMISLMFIGASPGSTGGGAKTVTVAVLLLAILSILRKRDDIEIKRRSLSATVVTHAIVIVVLFFLMISTVTLLLTWTERGLGPGGGDWRFIDLLFETVSAVATVGLSTGVTASLSSAGRFVIIAAMFFGRIGPLTLVLSLAFNRDQNPRRYKYPVASVMIG
jgi:trk system potassium uptake protein